MTTLLLCLVNQETTAQVLPPLADTLQQKMKRYQQLRPATLLFAHFDKTVYTNNENVWFTAYLLNCNTYADHHTLSVSLVSDMDRAIVLHEKFVMANGVGFGNVLLPDSIAPGNYTFTVYTNRLINHNPEAVFHQPVTIKSGAVPPFKAILFLKDTLVNRLNKPRQVVLSVTGADYMPVADATVKYKLAGKDTSIISGKAKTDRAGQYLINMPPGKSMLKVLIQDKKASQYMYLSLPDKNEMAQVKFYPESGHLINNVPSKVGWEATTPDGQPLKVTGVLYENGNALDTLYTDSYGMGRFLLYARSEHVYTLKLKGIRQRDTLYQLPKALSSGISLTARNPLANDTLEVQVRSSERGRYFINVHNFTHLYSCTPVKVDILHPLRVKVPLNEMPRGLAEVTVTDSAGHPMAERVFFSHFDQPNPLIFQTNKITFSTREKVNLKVRLDAKMIAPLQGFVSVACVQDNRIELKKVQDIESYFYLKSGIGTLPLKEKYMGRNPQDKAYLENVLLIKGWRKYTWQDMLNVKVTDTASMQGSLVLSGKLTKYDKPLKKAATVVLARDSSSIIFSTNDIGHFDLSFEQLLTMQDKKVRFITQTKDNYYVHIADPYLSVNKTLAHSLKMQSYEPSVSTLNSESFAIKGLERAIQLKEVTVVAKRDNSFFGATNKCGDYVCAFKILNCPNHVNAQHTLPVIGAVYTFNGMRTVYNGCSAESNGQTNTIHGIYLAKQFYGSDYAVANPTEPEYNSTIFWRHLVKINNEKETEMSFYTSDITGKFRIVIQGIAGDGVVYGESFINVKKP
ncbi:hypothetical protein [Mucilaginibacter sp. PAMB04168]|uniref:hypothetical protein n=1 Tax=Mucilaginibacter sp. PAMB04168 TaxID=3138567 RepID=UPI0031F62FC4